MQADNVVGVGGWAESNSLRVIGYAVVAALTFTAGVREQRAGSRRKADWPTFWFLTGGLLALMALGRAIEVGPLASDALRASAREGGWYESRRRMQAVVVAALAGLWLVSVVVAVWKVPERRRYLPMIVVVVTIVAFVTIRVVSLHQIDTVLHRRRLRGVSVGAIIEYVLLGAGAGCVFWTMSRERRGHAVRVAAHAEPPT